MLQQTTVKAVAPYFLKFTTRWPTVGDLATAAETDVMAAWAGLGYYSRARNLHACARTVAEQHGGAFPPNAADLSTLPGIGAYTSAAIAAIAFDEPIAVVDGNVERVISRVFEVGEPLPAAKAGIRALLQPLVPQDRPGEFAEATMDLGATICTPRKPACILCPWSANCRAHLAGEEEAYPVKAAKKERPVRRGLAFVARRTDGALLLRRREGRGLLGGMTEVPGSDWTARSDGEAVQPPLGVDWQEVAGTVEHTFTHFHLILTVHRAEIDRDVPAPDGTWWSPVADTPDEALPSLMKKAIEAAYPGATRPRPSQSPLADRAATNRKAK